MPTSELSDALNPYAFQHRSRSSALEYSPSVQHAPFQPIVQVPQRYLPHRSELELAISEPLPPPPRPEVVRTRPPIEGVQAVQELLRIVSATREAQEIERKRRLGWEQEQEAQAAQRQAEIDRKLLQMRQEIVSLRGALNAQRECSKVSTILTPQHNMSPGVSHRGLPQPVSPVSPIARIPPCVQPMFVQGSSNNPYPNLTQQPRPQSQNLVDNFHPQSTHVRISPAQSNDANQDPPQSLTPTPSPQSGSAASPHVTIIKPRNGKKRQNSALSSEGDGNSSSNSIGSRGSRPRKRVNHHDKRCLTIQHAMRAHFWRMIQVDSDEKLPDSHSEGVPLEPTHPVRFVWDKTTKQSVHNSRMKARILADIKGNRQRYRHVPNKDFGKKILESAFEQCFTTFRQKYKAQTDESVAFQHKKREELKARKARHASRRKLKLTSRAETRMKIQTLEHVVFDAALQLECMSSEESDFENDNMNRSSGVLRTRGYAWRSSKLLRFYSTLDQEEVSDKASKPKRGVGRKERLTGPPKEDAMLPPKGTATWMISRRWFKTLQLKHPDLPDALKDLVNDSVEFDWTNFHVLGEESEDSEGETRHRNFEHAHQHYNTTAFSLNYESVP